MLTLQADFNKKLYLYLVDYKKAFDRVKHKLTEAMKKSSIPNMKRKLILNLYWR